MARDDRKAGSATGRTRVPVLWHNRAGHVPVVPPGEPDPAADRDGR